MLGVFAEFETAICRERQMEGIARAKAEAVYKGRQPSIDPAKVQALAADVLGPDATPDARAVKLLGRSCWYSPLV
jgi:DNA invertase Pin-like site-specific DNA recombinase